MYKCVPCTSNLGSLCAVLLKCLKLPFFRQTDVLVLQTFDASGATEHFLGEFKGDRDPHFTGPGHKP